MHHFILLLFTFVHTLHTAPVDQPTYEPGVLYLPDKAISLDDGYRLSIQGVFGGIILICTGLLFGCRGVWDRSPTGRHTQNLSGFATMGLVTFVMLGNFEPESTYGTNRQTIYLIVPLVVGLVVIVCMPITYQLYLMLIGGLGGLALGLWILGWKEGLTITSEYGKAVLLTVLVLVFMIMSLYHHFFHILGAALSGSYVFFMGLDVYFHTGFLYCFTTALDVNPYHAHHYVMTRGVYIMQSTMIISFIVTYIIQGVSNIRNQHAVMMEYAKPYLPFGIAPQPGWRPTWRPAWPFFRRAVPPPASVPAVPASVPPA